CRTRSAGCPAGGWRCSTAPRRGCSPRSTGGGSPARWRSDALVRTSAHGRQDRILGVGGRRNVASSRLGPGEDLLSVLRPRIPNGIEGLNVLSLLSPAGPVRSIRSRAPGSEPELESEPAPPLVVGRSALVGRAPCRILQAAPLSLPRDPR